MAAIVRRKVPNNVSECQAKYFADDLQYSLPEKKTKTFRNVFILKYGAVWKGFRLVEESLIMPFMAKQYDLKFVVKSLFFFHKKFFYQKPVAIIYDAWSENIFHWLTDALPRLLLLEGKDFQLILPDHFQTRSYVTSSLACFGIKDIIWVKEQSICWANNLILPLHVSKTGNFDPLMIKRIAKKLSILASGSNKGRLVYVSRNKAQFRRVNNEDELVSSLEKLGFERVFLEEDSFEDQVSIFQNAEIILSAHGAGLANIIFMRPGSKVIELRNEAPVQNNCYFNLANAMDLEYYSIFCKGFSGTGFQQDDLIIDMKYTLETLQKII